MFKVIHWVLISRSLLLGDLLKTRWPQEFLVKLTNTLPDEVETQLRENRFSIAIIDLATVDVQCAYQLQKRIEKSPGVIRVVFIHFPKQIDARFLVQRAVTAGVFFSDASLDDLEEGLATILKGNSVIPEQFNQTVFDDAMELEDTESLTMREREVLQVLRTGSTNIDIANRLFVSESTIKTHLYRAFRKIGVSSRGQAIAWAQTNLHEVVQ